MFNVFPFENTIVVMYLSGQEIQDTLDFVAQKSAARGCRAQLQVAGITFDMVCQRRSDGTTVHERRSAMRSGVHDDTTARRRSLRYATDACDRVREEHLPRRRLPADDPNHQVRSDRRPVDPTTRRARRSS